MTHWTVSRLKNFETCPKQYQYAHVFTIEDWKKLGFEVVPAIPGKAAARGTRIHETIEQYLLTGDIKVLDPEITSGWRAMIVNLRGRAAVPEQMWEFSEGWYEVDAEHALWARGKLDAHYWPKLNVLKVIDFKTGKPYRSNREQLEVYSVMAFARFDDVHTVEAELWYLDSEQPDEQTFKRSQVEKLARKWEGRARPLLTATKFPAKPGNHCGWCAFREICPDRR